VEGEAIMKTDIFDGSAIPIDEKFHKDIKALCNLKAAQLEQIAELFVCAHTEATDPLKSLSYGTVSKYLHGLGLQPEEAGGIFWATSFLFDCLTDIKALKKPADIASDIKEIIYPDENEYAALLHFIGKINSLAVRYVEHQRISSVEEFGPPSFAGLGTSAEIRAVIENPYRFSDDITNYAPEIDKYVIRGTIRISLDRYPDRAVVFQVNQKELDFLLNGLQALRKGMNEIAGLNKGKINIVS
jgi:hypothetical protein